MAAEPHAPDGKDYLSYALRCTGFGLLQSMFQAHGDAITPTQLIDLNGKATPLLNQIVEEKSTPDLFTVDFWRDHSSRELRQVFHALPERVQHSGLPYHQLMSWKKREERLTARVGGEGIAHG